MRRRIPIQPNVTVQAGDRRVTFIGLTLMRRAVMVEYVVDPPLQRRWGPVVIDPYSGFVPVAVALEATDDTSDEAYPMRWLDVSWPRLGEGRTTTRLDRRPPRGARELRIDVRAVENAFTARARPADGPPLASIVVPLPEDHAALRRSRPDSSSAPATAPTPDEAARSAPPEDPGIWEVPKRRRRWRRMHLALDPSPSATIDGHEIRFRGLSLLNRKAFLEYDVRPALPHRVPLHPELLVVDVTDDVGTGRYPTFYEDCSIWGPARGGDEGAGRVTTRLDRRPPPAARRLHVVVRPAEAPDATGRRPVRSDLAPVLEFGIDLPPTHGIPARASRSDEESSSGETGPRPRG